MIDRVPILPKWLFPCLLTLLLWGSWGVIYKVIGARLTAVQSQALSTLGILPIVLLLAGSPRRLSGARKLRGSVYAFSAGMLSGLGNIAYYQAIDRGGKASTAAAVTALYPVATILLAMLILKEKPRRLQLGGIVGSLGAIYLFNVGAARIWFPNGSATLWHRSSVGGVPAFFRRFRPTISRPSWPPAGSCWPSCRSRL